MSEDSSQKSGERHYAFVVEVPVLYTADIDELRKVDAGCSVTESDFLLNCCGEPSAVRMRMEISGEKDSEVVEVWGLIREAKLVEPSRGYGDGPHLTDEQLADAAGHKLLRDERACGWCMTNSEALRDD